MLPRLSAPATPGLQVVRHDVLPQPPDVGGEDPATGSPSQGVDEPSQTRIIAEDEGVDGGAVANQLVHLRNGRSYRLWNGRPTEERLMSTDQMGGRLAVSDDEYHWFGVRMATQMSAGKQQRMLQIRALDPFRLRLSQLHGGQLARGAVKADDLERVVPEARLDEVVECQRSLFHGPPATVLHHRERQIDAKRNGSAGPPLRLGDLEILDLELDGG